MVRFYILLVLTIIKSLSISRIWNLILLQYFFLLSYFFKIHKTTIFPSFVSIEPTNICNLQCPECPTGNNSSTVEKGKISLELLQKIIPQLSKKTIFVNLYFQGEPFIHENLAELIRIISKHKMISSISTNAHFITKENAEAIVQSGLTKIIVSLDGYNQETYEIYRKNGSFEKVLQGLEYLKKAKETYKSNLPLIELQCLLFKHTEHHTSEIKAIGKKYSVDIVTFKTAQFYDLENKHLIPDKKNSRYTFKNDTLELQKPIRNKCWRMWSSLVISWQGNVIPCCFDKNHTYTYGNCFTEDLHTIIESKNTSQFKTKVHTNRKSIKMCKNCTS